MIIIEDYDGIKEKSKIKIVINEFLEKLLYIDKYGVLEQALEFVLPLLKERNTEKLKRFERMGRLLNEEGHKFYILSSRPIESEFAVWPKSLNPAKKLEKIKEFAEKFRDEKVYYITHSAREFEYIKNELKKENAISQTISQKISVIKIK